MKTLATTCISLLLLLVTATAGPLTTGQRISLALEDVPITAALNMIAEQNELNLVVAGDVGGNVTLRLDDVDIATALDAILTANGFNYFLKDNVIVVKSTAADAAGELETRVIRLDFVKPVTAEKALAAVKSSKGSVTILDRQSQGSAGGQEYQPNRILISDYPNLIEKMLAVLEEIDIQERSVMIEAKIIETTIDSETNLGITWPTSMSASLSGADGAVAGDETTAIDDPSGQASGLYDPNNGSWAWGKLSVGEVNWILNMLELDGNSRLVSDPRITTLENHPAEFKFETVIPIQTINRFTEGAATSDIVTYEDEEIGISLKVLARINDSGKVTMEVQPIVEDILGYTGPTDNQKPITASRSIITTITVRDGETVALGGLLKETEIERIQRVPLLGHIPLIGAALFSSKSTEKTSTDLLILITPHILD